MVQGSMGNVPEGTDKLPETHSQSCPSLTALTDARLQGRKNEQK
jgi:hypothetical protein